MSVRLSLRTVHPPLCDQARTAFLAGDIPTMLVSCRDRHLQLQFVLDNVPQLQVRGIFEPCLLQAFKNCKTNYSEMPSAEVRRVFQKADRERLRRFGDPVPSAPVLRVYRGIAGVGQSRHPDGVSWTRSLDVACWFATRLELPRPAVVTAEVRSETILTCVDEFLEQEVIWIPERVEVLALTPDELAEHTTRHLQTLDAWAADRTALAGIENPQSQF